MGEQTVAASAAPDSTTPKAGACAMVIFGGGGDLTKRLGPPARDHHAPELARARVDPVRVLENDQRGPIPHQGLQLVQQRLEPFLALALWGKVELGGGTRQ